MCTDYDVWYACGHRAAPARIAKPPSGVSDIYYDCASDTPTSRVVKNCKAFQETRKVCQPTDRLVITETWSMVCSDKSCKAKMEDQFDDRDCYQLRGRDSEIEGRREAWLKGKSEGDIKVLRKKEASLCQPQVWGRKGPHIKRTRNSKTREEREREKAEREQAAAEGIVETSTAKRCRKKKKKGVVGIEAAEESQETDKEKVKEKPKQKRSKKRVIDEAGRGEEEEGGKPAKKARKVSCHVEAGKPNKRKKAEK
ncbi:hypothetical protein ABW19_dt0209226 [Dactylella cylindrospora]|nr:hypothetical protein ABW19_dt0209226 [Dactylella cylindrospora]